MFKKIALDNFRSFTHAVLDLEAARGVPKRYALIYGENGSGKTNLVESVMFLRDSMRTLAGGDRVSGRRPGTGGTGGGETPSQPSVPIRRPSDMALGDMEDAAGPVSIRTLSRGVKTIGSEEPMRLSYTFTVNGRDATYELGFSDDGRVTHEKLMYTVNDRVGRYFEIDSTEDGISLKINSGLIGNRRFRSQLKESAERLWGNHTFLSVLYAECGRSNREYVQSSVRPEMLLLMDYIDGIVVDCPPRGPPSGIWPMDLVGGDLPSEMEGALDAYGNAIDTFFTRLYTDIGRAYYRKTHRDGVMSYTLMFSRRISGTYRDIPASVESSGTLKLLDLLPALLECSKGAVVFIDELDSGIHDKLIHDLMEEVLSGVSGQIVVTTHNTSLIREVRPANVYVISQDALGNKDVRSTDTVKNSQKTHNNERRYMNGEFGGIPYIGTVDLEDIASTLHQELGG